MVVWFRPFDDPPIRAPGPTNWPAGAREGSRASPSLEGHALAALGPRSRSRSFSNPAGPEASGPRCARWRGCQARPNRGRLSQPPNYAAEPGRPAWLPPPLSPAAPAPGASPRPRRPGGSAEARRGSTWAERGRRARRFRSCAPARAPRLQVRRPRRAGPTDSAARAAASRHQTRCGQPAGTGKEEAPLLEQTGEERSSWARREPSAQAPRLPLRASPALLPALGASPGGRGGPGGGAGARAGVLLRLGRGFPASFWVNFQSAKC